MFHHFHGGAHLPAQGSLSSLDLENMINWLDKNYTLLGAREYRRKFDEGALRGGDICLSFDDALKCQFDIAVPVLREKNIDAFFFVYSSAFMDNPDPLEIYRYFRTAIFEEIDGFYKAFFEKVEESHGALIHRHQKIYKGLDYLSGRPYYSSNDKWFRYIRDQVIDKLDYQDVMEEMMVEKGFEVGSLKQKLWMSEKELKSLFEIGHTIGMHSFSHPTQISKLSKMEQFSEYSKNKAHLEQILDLSVDVMSHPCGDYNSDTLEVLQQLDVRIGFCAKMPKGKYSSALEMPRENHANVLEDMKR